MTTEQELDDARAALAELDRYTFSDGVRKLVDRCRPLLELSEAEATLAKIRAVVDRPRGTLEYATRRDLAEIKTILNPPPRPFEVGDPVDWCGGRRKVVAVNNNGTLDISCPGLANHVNVNAADCKRVDQ